MTDPTPQPGPAVTSLTAKAGDKVDNYTIMEQIGAGGTAVVFRGHDHVLNRDVAIKQLVVPAGDAGEDIRQRAVAEAELHKRAAASDPKLLVQYIDTINEDRGLFLISEYVDGPSLEWILQEEPRPMEQRQALGIIAASAKALDALHRAGMVHRDLKPSNILMPREGGLKLADFGLAAIIAEQQSMDLGSVRYMAPEVLQGEPATPKSDLYALGMIAYEMLAGRELFGEAFRTILRDQRSQSMRWVKWHTNARAKVTPLDQLVDGIPESLAGLVARMMEKDPSRRVGSATELIEAIRAHFANGGQEPQTPAPHAAMAPPKIEDVSQTAEVPQRSKLPIILAAMLVFWVLGIGGFFLYRNHQDQLAEQAKITAVHTDLREAEGLLNDGDYDAARAAFAAIPEVHGFTPGKTSYIGDLVEAGREKSLGMIAVQDDRFIEAVEHFQRYASLMARNRNDPPAEPRTTLSYGDAEDKVAEYDRRSNFQKIANQIDAQLEAGQLDAAIEQLRALRDDNTITAADDLARLDELEAKYRNKLDGERIAALIQEARDLLDAGDMRDAIRLLEDESERTGDDTDPSVTTELEKLQRLALIQDIEQRISRARRSGDKAEELDALKELQQVARTEDRDEEIRKLEVAMLVEEAELALADNLPEKAEQLLKEAEALEPGNEQVARMQTQIDNARLKVAAITRGDQLVADGDFARAVAQYRLALDYGPDTSGTINEKISDATGRLHFANAEQALGSGDVALAQTELDKAKAELGDTDPVADLQTRIDNLRAYTLLINDGDTLFANGDFGRAKAKYIAAREIFDSEAVNQKVRDCDFGIWLDQCDRAILSRDWEAAEGALKRAEEIKINEQTAERRAKIEGRVQ